MGESFTRHKVAARWSRATVVAACLVAFSGACGGGDDPANVVITIPSNTLMASSIFVAQDLGLFERAGLHVQVRTIVGVGSVNAVLAGDADFTIGTGATFLRAWSQGQQFVAIANMVDRPLVELVLRHDVAERVAITAAMPLAERATRLKGLTIAVQGVGSVVHAWARHVLNLGGLDVERDVLIVPMEPPAMLTALRNGVIDGFTTSIPFTTQAVLGGDAVMLASGLTDAPELVPFAYALLYARPETCVQTPSICSKLSRALAAAVAVIRESSDTVFEQVIRYRYPTMNVRLLRNAWDIARGAHATDVAVTVSSLENAQRLSLSARLLDQAHVRVTFDGLYTAEFLK
jgi:NitT/TauT family transport system substrate-binding protein